MASIRIFFFAFCLLISGAGLFSQTVLESLDDIAAFGADNNLDYRSSRNNVLKSENNLEGFFHLNDSSISATGSYDESTGQFGVSSTVEIPVIDQITLSGTVNQDLSGNTTLSLNPLAHSAEREQSKISYQAAMNSAEEARLTAENDAISAALDWMTAKRELETQKLQTELSRTAYEDQKVRYDKGETTFDDLQDSLVQWSQDRVSLATCDNSYKNAESSLYSVLGVGKEDVSVRELGIEDLEKAVDALMAGLDSSQGEVQKSSQYKAAVIEKMNSAAVLENIWSYEPDLKVGASVNFSPEGIGGVSASVTFSFSPNDIQTSERKAAKEEYAIASVKEKQSRNNAELKLNQLLDTIDSTAINRSIAEIEMNQAETLLAEAELLYKRGDRSRTELDQTRVSLQTSENSLFKALAQQYEAWCSLKEFL